MRALALVIRHGDRSAIHSIANTTGPQAAWRCIPLARESSARKEWIALRATFVVRSLRGGGVLTRNLRPQTNAADSRSCEPGQLTPRGFEQHVRNGKHMGLAYAPFLRALASSARGNGSAAFAYVRSTDYQRTLLSAAGLLLGMLRPHSALRPSPARPLEIVTEEDEAKDILHGLARSQIAAWVPDAEAWAHLSKLFGPSSYAALQTTGAADTLYARACHGLPTPCAAAGCVSSALAARVWEDADRYYCARYGGESGGERSSRLAMLPLLRELLGRLDAAAAGAPQRLVLFSGHDTVVAPVLAALGAFRAPGACKWPPYASHVAIELWDGPRTLQPRKGAVQPEHEVRVVFNGQPLTQYLRGCDAHAARLQGAGAKEFCPLSVLKAAVAGLAKEFERACKV